MYLTTQHVIAVNVSKSENLIMASRNFFLINVSDYSSLVKKFQVDKTTIKVKKTH